jgi:NAD(P)-dependent dehydrogenase (short-subunit alcohol dehydrogenase family)
MELKNKVALVTGASRGIGAAIALALAKQGCHVACADRSTRDNPDRISCVVEETVEKAAELGVKALAIPTNLTDLEQIKAMVEAANSHFGGIDILINNAAVTAMGDLFTDLNLHNLIMDVNLQAPMVALRECVPSFRTRGGGSVVNISSVAALYPQPGQMSYGISKAGLERFTVDAANQLQADNIAVNCFRIDMPVASEGLIANTAGMDRDNWESCDVVAEGVLWALRQNADYSGRLISMNNLRKAEGIMNSKAKKAFSASVPTTLVEGLLDHGTTIQWSD